MQTFLLVLFSILFLNLLPIGNKRRTKVILPISFLILWVFLAFRYNYGVDYISYNHLFYNSDDYSRSVESEPLFWRTMGLFKYYYQFIIFQTTALCLTCFYFVRKYIPSHYYWLFFLIFMCHSGMMFTAIAALRSSFAAIVFMWGTEFFFLRKSRPLLYLLSIIFAYFFHNSALLLVLFPFSDIIVRHLSRKGWVFLVLIGFVVSLTSITHYVELLLNMFSSTSSISGYSDYVGGKFVDSSFTVAVTHLILAAPCYFLFENVLKNNIAVEYQRIASISLVFMILHMLGIDFQNRLMVCVFLLYIISIISLLPSLNQTVKCAVLGFVVFSTVWSCYVMFSILAFQNPEGSFWYYQTIFDLPKFP